MIRLTKDQALQLLKYGQAEIRWKDRDGGKLDILVLNEMTIEPLELCLRYRQGQSKNTDEISTNCSFTSQGQGAERISFGQ